MNETMKNLAFADENTRIIFTQVEEFAVMITLRSWQIQQFMVVGARRGFKSIAISHVMWTSPDKSPRSARRSAILAPILALVLSGLFAFEAGSNEITGKATPGVGRGQLWSRNEVLTREDSPSKFRDAANLLWGLSGFCLVVSAFSFRYYRKIDADSDDYS